MELIKSTLDRLWVVTVCSSDPFPATFVLLYNSPFFFKGSVCCFARRSVGSHSVWPKRLIWPIWKKDQHSTPKRAQVADGNHQQNGALGKAKGGGASN